MEKLLSIIIPTYNTEQYLPRCIDSLIVPEYLEHIEILIVIDGSPDNSLLIAQKYEALYPETIQVINKENGGHGSTINKGLELAKGKYIRILDSDDWFHTNNFPLYLSKLSMAEEDIVMTHLVKELVFEHKSVLELSEGIIFDKTYNTESLDYDNLPVNFFGMARCTYKTELLREHNLQLLEKSFYEDSFLHIFPLKYLETFVFYDLVIYHYFLGRPEQSVSREVALRHYEHWHKVIKQIIEFYIINKLVFSPSKEKFVLRVISYYITKQYSQMINFEYKKAKNELDKWDKYVFSLPFLQKVTNYKIKLYSFLPYFIYRYSFQLRSLLLVLTNRFVNNKSS